MYKKNIFKGWTAAIGSFIVIFMNIGVICTFPIFLPAISIDQNWDVAAIAIMLPFSTGSAFLMNLVLGNFLKRFEIKFIMIFIEKEQLK